MSSPTTTQPAGGPEGPGGGGGARQEIADFVSAVRANLDDLSADEVAELTGGLEADLTDALAEEPGSVLSPAQRYGDPADYAGELRSAAGLPPRSGAASRGDAAVRARRRRQLLFGPDPAALTRIYHDGRTAVEQHPQWPAVREFLIVLRPAWWVLRAWVAVQLLLATFGAERGVVRGGFAGFLLLLLAIVISVQLGRNSPFADNSKWLAMTAGNLIAVVAFLPVVATSGGHDTYYSSQDSSYAPSPGLSLDGNGVSNVFAYDADGHLLTGVQLYDQDGHPLNISPDARDSAFENTDETVQPAAGTSPGTPQRWNVFPLQEQPMVQHTDAATGEESAEPGPVQSAQPPFTAVPPVIAGPAPTATDTPAGGNASPSPSGSPLARGESAPEGTSTPGASALPSPAATTK
jgi:hypothetical protein